MLWDRMPVPHRTLQRALPHCRAMYMTGQCAPGVGQQPLALYAACKQTFSSKANNECTLAVMYWHPASYLFRERLITQRPLPTQGAFA